MHLADGVCAGVVGAPGWWCLCGCSGCTWLVVFVPMQWVHLAGGVCAGAVVWDVGGAGVVYRSKPNSRSVYEQCDAGLNPTADQCMNSVVQ